jgi:hypothetical protein
MKQIKLDKGFVDYLREQPESGMGFQYVTVTLENGVILEKLIVLNCDTIGIPKKYSNIKITDLR